MASPIISSLLINCPLSDGDSEIHVNELNERPYVGITLWWLNKQGIKYKEENLERFFIKGKQFYKPFKETVPADFSSATFFLCAGAITNSEITLKGLDMNDTQGDKRVVNILKDMGANIDITKEGIKIKGGNLKIYQDFILHTADKYPGKIATHLIVGMGETEKEMVDMIQELHEHEVIIALFAFTPVKGAKLEFKQEPNISSYRRIQVALYLVRNNLDKSFVYNDNGQITNFGYNKDYQSIVLG